MRILHLSDVHFGTNPKNGKSTHAFTNPDKKANPAILPSIISEDPVIRDKQPVDAIVLSGDLGWAGKPEDYELARTFLNALQEQHGLSERQLVICPGNHDFDRDETESTNRQDQYFHLLQKFYGDQFEDLYPFFDPDNPRKSLIAFHPLGELLIVSVNSAAIMGDKEDKSIPIYVDPSILAEIERCVHKVQGNPLRIFVIHHHLLPFVNPKDEDNYWQPEDPDPTTVANSAYLQTWLEEQSFDLVLHGHRHQTHNREDILWQPGQGKEPKSGRRLIVVSAGSAGVFKEQLQGEPLTYNIIETTRVATKRWSIEVDVREIHNRRARRRDIFRTWTGEPPQEPPHVFQAENMDDCHRAISVLKNNKGESLYNFVSTVENCEYIFPEETINPRFKEEDVQRSFQALHPEWDNRDGWSDIEGVNTRLHELPDVYQFQHGPRLFGLLGGTGSHLRRVNGSRFLQPIHYAIDNLRKKNDTHAYIGLYNPAIDVGSRNQPLPGLMSIQFVPNRGKLDVVATFRKLELSFWWVVNMREMERLLRWTTDEARRDLKPGRITFFAAIAVWREDPEPVFVTTLDRMARREVGQLSCLVQGVNNGNSQSCNHLANLLAEKKDAVNDVNIDLGGFRTLLDMIHGITHPKQEIGYEGSSSPLLEQLEGTLEEIIRRAHTAVVQEQSSQNGTPELKRVKERLEVLVEKLRSEEDQK